MPNAQAQIDATSQWYLQQGVLGATILLLLGLLVIAGVVIRTQYNRNETLSERTIKALEESASADERVREVLQGLVRQLETRSQTLGELSNLVSLNGTELRHGFGNTTQILEGILKTLMEPRALALNLADRIRLIWRHKGQPEDVE